MFVFVFSCDRKDERVSGMEVACLSSYLCAPHVGAEQGHIRVTNKITISFFPLFPINPSSSSFSSLLARHRFKAEDVAMVTVWSN